MQIFWQEVVMAIWPEGGQGRSRRSALAATRQLRLANRERAAAARLFVPAAAHRRARTG